MWSHPLALRLAAGLCGALFLVGGSALALEDKAETFEAEALEWLAGYLRIDTTNPPGNEAASAAYLARILHSEGIATRLLVTPGGRTNLFARLPATQPGKKALVLLHHMDVVAATEGWSHDPFGAEIDSQRIWGRGAIDAKSLGIAHLAAFIDAKRSGRRRERDLIYLAVADEETGGSQGAGWLLEQHGELFADGVEGVLNEGGSNRTIGDRLLWWGIEVAQKRPLWVEVSTDGRGGHGSAYNPRSATHRLTGGLAQLLIQPHDYRVTAAARDYFEAIAPYHNEAFQRVFVGSSLAAVQQRFAEMLEDKSGTLVLMPGMLAYFMDTIQVTSIETSSTTINVVPEKIKALIDIRLLPDTEVEEMLAVLRESFGPTATIKTLLSSPITPSSPLDTEIFRAMERTLGSEAPLVPTLITGTTDSRYFRERGIPAYGFSPFVLSGEEVRGIHGPDESIPLRKFNQGLGIMRRVVQACLGG